MYLFYIYYLKHKEQTLLNGIESYVLDCINDGQVNWMPIYRSYSLEQLNVGYGKDIEDEVYDDINHEFDKFLDKSNKKQEKI